ncbi:MAG: hypothetical protein GF313_08075 [Caldithrix sp.]|nr:hypothetical protein [Caldithrix sp.]
MQSLSKNKIKQLNKLKQKKYRDQYEMYMVSGFRHARAAVNAQNVIIEYILVTADGFKQMDQLGTVFRKIYDIPLYQINDNEMKSLSDEQSSQGIVMVLRKPTTGGQRPKPSPGNTAIYLYRINDPGNLGTIIRTALWFGFQNLLLSPGSADPYQPKAVRSAAGYSTYATIYDDVNMDDLMHLRTQGFHLISASVEGGQPPSQISLSPDVPFILLLGSEAHGLPDECREKSDHVLTIPKYGFGESLNLGVAAGIILSHLAGNRQTTNPLNKGLIEHGT